MINIATLIWSVIAFTLCVVGMIFFFFMSGTLFGLGFPLVIPMFVLNKKVRHREPAVVLSIIGISFYTLVIWGMRSSLVSNFWLEYQHMLAMPIGYRIFSTILFFSLIYLSYFFTRKENYQCRIWEATTE